MNPSAVSRASRSRCLWLLFATTCVHVTFSLSAAPNPPVIVGITPDTGVAHDGITSALSISIDGTADPNATVTLGLPLHPGIYGSVKADQWGNWSVGYQTAAWPLGAFDFVAYSTDSLGSRSANSNLYRAWIAPAAVVNGTIARATVGMPVDFDQTPRVFGAWPVGVNLGISGLPPGLTFNGSQITGTPTTAGLFRITVTAANGAGSDQKTYSLVIASSGPPSPGPWQCRDIGTSTAGSTSLSGGSFTVQGSGADIWNRADGFHFYYQTLNGDGKITARITSLQDTNGWAKAGVMIRSSLERSASNVFVAATPARGVIAQYRSAANDITNQLSGPSVGAPYWVRLTRAGNMISAASSPDGLTWTHFGPMASVSMGSSIYIGLAVTSHADGIICRATFDNVAISTSTSPLPPQPTWSFADIGAVGIGGSTTSGTTTITVGGSGADIWDTSDQFRFVWKPHSGDGVVEARVTAMEDTHSWAKAGVMIRDSNLPGARNVFVALTPAWNGITAQARDTASGTTQMVPGPRVNTPYSIRLTRAGNTFIAYTSDTGTNWMPFATFTVPMSMTANFGFAVTSHDNTKLSQAVFADPFVGSP